MIHKLWIKSIISKPEIQKKGVSGNNASLGWLYIFNNCTVFIVWVAFVIWGAQIQKKIKYKKSEITTLSFLFINYLCYVAKMTYSPSCKNLETRIRYFCALSCDDSNLFTKLNGQFLDFKFIWSFFLLIIPYKYWFHQIIRVLEVSISLLYQNLRLLDINSAEFTLPGVISPTWYNMSLHMIGYLLHVTICISQFYLLIH